MTTPASRSLALGFLHIRRSSPEVFRGGYLITSEYGRPIEFHYSSEVTVPRSHQVLYGKQFEPQLSADVLAKPMTDRQGTAPRLILVDTPALLDLRRLIPAPVVLVQPRPDLVGEKLEEGVDPLLPPQAHPDFTKDLAAFEKIRSLVPPGFDWMEPFARIEEALAEIREPSLSFHAA